MSRPEHTPVVPLEAGAGPDNPPCPACGEPLFGWLPALPGLAGPVRRCESCGLGVAGEAPQPGEAPAALDRLGSAERVRIDNRAGVACSLGGPGWAGLRPGARFLFSVESVRRLVAARDQLVVGRRWIPGASVALTWQTLLNSVTFGRNVALGALGRGAAAPAARPWQRRIDAFASVVLALPALALAVPIELVAAALGKGAVYTLKLQLL